MTGVLAETVVLPGALAVVAVDREPVAQNPLLGEPDVDAVALPTRPGADGVRPGSGTAELMARYGIDLAELAQRLELDGHAGEAHTVQLPRALGDVHLPWAGLPSRLVLVGEGTGDPRDLRIAGAAVAGAASALRRVVTTVGAEAEPEGTQALVEGYLIAAHRPGRDVSAPALVLIGQHSETAVERARHFAAATCTVRQLTADPASTRTPQWLAEEAAAAARAAGLGVEVLERRELIGRGFSALVAVGAGSASEPRLVTLRYEPKGAGKRRRGCHVVIVGKGITFDAAGPADKRWQSMAAQKTDMASAAVALAVVLGAASAGLPHRVTAVLALAGSAPGVDSYRPGEVLRSYGGTTVEVVHADAEGHLVLADALSHADADLGPDILVDIATLTGTAPLGLGRGRGALFTPDDTLATQLRVAGDASGEPVWRFPLDPDYASALDSEVADIRHADDPDAGAGAITAALFLQRFVGSRRWAHLDVAGPARAAGAAHGSAPDLAGFGVRLLLRWLEDL